MLENFEKIHNLIPEILEESNLDEAFKYVWKDIKPDLKKRHLRTEKKRASLINATEEELLQSFKNHIIEQLKEEIASGTFVIRSFKTIHVKDGPKERDVQAPDFYSRVGCHAIINKFEERVYPTVIPTSAASIKGRGMHYLLHLMQEDMKQMQGNIYYYKCDIEKFYDHIDQDKMFADLHLYTDDEILLRIFKGFVYLMPQGLSKGLRSSQCFANLHLNSVDYHITEDLAFPHYARYCDDIVMWLSGSNDNQTKKQLWKLRDELVGSIHERGLEVKKNEAVRPLDVGLDFLGFVQYPKFTLIRKRIKQNAARKLARVKSRTRRQEIIGSFKGMASHADCKHLYRKLTGKNMKKFSEMGVTYVPEDGKKRFPGNTVRLSSIVNKAIVVCDFERDMKTENGDDRYLVSIKDEGTFKKFFTASKEMKQILDKISDIEDGFPFETTIKSEVFGDNKIKYMFT